LAQAIAQPRNIFSESETGLAQLRKIPTLLVWGAQDRLVDLRNLARWRSALPDAQELVLPKAGHFPMDEAHDAVLPRLKEFLSR
jgi:haloalkane dehalogenase